MARKDESPNWPRELRLFLCEAPPSRLAAVLTVVTIVAVALGAIWLLKN